MLLVIVVVVLLLHRKTYIGCTHKRFERDKANSYDYRLLATATVVTATVTSYKLVTVHDAAAAATTVTLGSNTTPHHAREK
jgi:hypothetical protein